MTRFSTLVTDKLACNSLILSFVLQGYGDNKPKSSTTAQEVKTLDGVYIEQVNGHVSEKF